MHCNDMSRLEAGLRAERGRSLACGLSGHDSPRRGTGFWNGILDKAACPNSALSVADVGKSRDKRLDGPCAIAAHGR